jgi:hypothetical protein
MNLLKLLKEVFMSITINLAKKDLFDAVKRLDEKDKLELFNTLENETIIVRARKIKQSISRHNLKPDDVLSAVKNLRR